MPRITASPGTFCDAMVTMNSGKAMLTTAAMENSGTTSTGFGQISASAPAGIGVAKMTMPAVTSTASGTA